MSNLIKPRTAEVTIYTGDYLDQIRHFERRIEAIQDAIDDAKKVAGATSNDSGGSPSRLEHEIPEYMELEQERDELIAKHGALVDEAETEALRVIVQFLGRKKSKALRAMHPPRVAGDGVTERQARSDERIGVNEETFKEALVRGSDVEIDGVMVRVASVISPDLTDDDFDEMADNDFDRIYLAAFALNWGPVADPKASLVSQLTQKNDETSS